MTTPDPGTVPYQPALVCMCGHSRSEHFTLIPGSMFCAECVSVRKYSWTRPVDDASWRLGVRHQFEVKP